MTERRDAPANVASLRARIRNEAQADPRSDDENLRTSRLELAVANIVVLRLLPSGIVKGGAAMQLRYGAGARFTQDLDAARPAGVSSDDFVDALADALEEGWAGFTGRVVEQDVHHPEGVPAEYVMQPFKIELLYNGSWWRNVLLELGHDELGSAEAGVLIEPSASAVLFAKLGLPDPGPLPVLRAEHQVAQKLHACTGTSADGSNDRARDLVDLQLLADVIDLAETREIAQRVFRYRGDGRAWPPEVAVHASWSGLYDEASQGLPVKATVVEAAEWVRDLIARIDAAG